MAFVMGGGEMFESERRSNDIFADVPPDFQLPPGNVEKGRKLFKKYCAQCHSIYPDNRITQAGQSALGPTLFNIYGRASGMAEIQNKQAADERCQNVLWTAIPLMNYMKNPRQLALGNVQMNFRGLPDIQTRVDIVHYLMTLDWNNKELMNPPEKPPSFAPARWAQKFNEGTPARTPEK